MRVVSQISAGSVSVVQADTQTDFVLYVHDIEMFIYTRVMKWWQWTSQQVRGTRKICHAEFEARHKGQ